MTAQLHTASPEDTQADRAARAAECCLQVPLRQLPPLVRSLHALAKTCDHDPLAELCLAIERGAEASCLRLTEPFRATAQWMHIVDALHSRVASARPIVYKVLCMLESRLRRGVRIRAADATALLGSLEVDSAFAAALLQGIGEPTRIQFEEALRQIPAPGRESRAQRCKAIERARRLHRLLRPFSRHGDQANLDLSFLAIRKAELQYSTWREHSHVADLHPVEVECLGSRLMRLLVDDPSAEVTLVATLFFLELSPAQLRAVFFGNADGQARICCGRFIWPAKALRKRPSPWRTSHQLATTTDAGFSLPVELVTALGPEPASPVRLDIALGVDDALLARANELLMRLAPSNRPLTVGRLKGFTRFLIDAADDDGLAVAMTGRFALASPAVVHYVFASASARNCAARDVYQRIGFSGELANPLTDDFALNLAPGDEDLRLFLNRHLRAIEAVVSGMAPNAGTARLVDTYCRLSLHAGVVLQLLTALRACRVMPLCRRGIDLERAFAIVWDKSNSVYWARRPVGLCTLAIQVIATYVRVASLIAQRLNDRGEPLGGAIAERLDSDCSRPLLCVVVDGKLRPIGAADLRPHFAVASLELNAGRRMTRRIVREAGLSSVVASAQLGHGVEGQEAFGFGSGLSPATTLHAVGRAWDRKLAFLSVSLTKTVAPVRPSLGAPQLRLRPLPVVRGREQACPFPADLAHRLRVADWAEDMVAKQPPRGAALLVVSLILRDGVSHPGLLQAVLKSMFEHGIQLPASGEAVRLVVATVPGIGLRNVRLCPETLRAAALLPPIDAAKTDDAVQSALTQGGEYCHRVLALGATPATALTTLLSAVEAVWIYDTPGIVRAFARFELIGRATCPEYVLGTATSTAIPTRPIQAAFEFDGDHQARVGQQLRELRGHVADLASTRRKPADVRNARDGIQLLMSRPTTAEIVRECCSVVLQLLTKALECETIAAYVSAIEPFVVATSTDLDLSFADLDFAAAYAAWERDASDNSTENRRKRAAMVSHIARHLGLALGPSGVSDAVMMRRPVPGLRMDEVMAARQLVLRDPGLPIALREDAAGIGVLAALTGGRFGEVVHVRAGDLLRGRSAWVVWYSDDSGAKEKSDSANRAVTVRSMPDDVIARASSSGAPPTEPLFSTVLESERAMSTFVDALRAVAPRHGVRCHTLRGLFATSRLLDELLSPDLRPSLRTRALFWTIAVELGHYHLIVAADHYFFRVDELLRDWWDRRTACVPLSDALLGALAGQSCVNVRQRRHRTGLVEASLLKAFVPDGVIRKAWLVRTFDSPGQDQYRGTDDRPDMHIGYRDLIAYLCARTSAGSPLLAAKGTSMSEAAIRRVEVSLTYLRKLGRHDSAWPQIRGDWSASDLDWILRLAMSLGSPLRTEMSLLSLCASLRASSTFLFSAPDDLDCLPLATSLVSSHSVQLRVGTRQQHDAWVRAAAACGIFRVVVGQVPQGAEATLVIKRSLHGAVKGARRDEHDYVWTAAVAAMVVKLQKVNGDSR